MDRITASDKFKQLRSNLTGIKLHKTSKNYNNREKLYTNITGVRVLENHDQSITNTFIRRSPRRCHDSKKFDFKKLHCSFISKTNPGETAQPESLKILKGPTISSSGTNQKSRNEEAGTNTNYINAERDSSGFLKPLHPAPKRNLYATYVDEELKTFYQLMTRLIDSGFFHEVEIAYHIEKMFNHCRQTACKLLRKTNSRMAVTQSASSSNRIHSWLQSSQGLMPDSRADNLEKSSKLLSQLNENSLNASEDSHKITAYLLKDWSVVKGSEKAEIMVMGMLIDVRSRKVLEQNHKSSRIIERTGNNFVKTICCTYQLCGNFVDVKGGVPPEIKKYFKDGKFPENWESITSQWHSICVNSGTIPRGSKNNIEITSKRCLEELLKEGQDLKVKKVKSNYNGIRQATHGNESRQSAAPSSMNSNLLLNSSILTRSATRRNRLLS